ncbi:hypothetical protein ElyMa_006928800 [Elysia marginata]|uniref:Uncharacterized protein n=1 Tax=Elysia marginata TaxID=1093978 RepID=A0AAV4JFJ9_9GAST|nr:hypothetical protein ElyMa_006928800 [Elysia marginata]
MPVGWYCPSAAIHEGHHKQSQVFAFQNSPSGVRPAKAIELTTPANQPVPLCPAGPVTCRYEQLRCGNGAVMIIKLWSGPCSLTTSLKVDADIVLYAPQTGCTFVQV